MNRAEIERSISDEELALEEIVGLLESRASLESWPDARRAAFARALTDLEAPLPERWKLVVLRRHLFGAAGALPTAVAVPPVTASSADRRLAERLRDALVACVPYGAGRYLLP